MPEERLDQKSFKAAGISIILRFLTQALQLGVGILLVRLLSPHDYGLWGIIMVFWTLSQIFVEGGFAKALLQRKEITQIELSSVFYYNLVISLLCWGIIAFSSSWIAQFFAQPELATMLPVAASALPISALCSIQHTILNHQLRQGISNTCGLISYVLTVPITLYMAWKGWGAWALVWQSVIGSIISSAVVFIAVRWIPSLVCSFTVLKSLFVFGSNLLCAALLNSIFGYLYNIVIGKVYPIETLGYYDRARQYSSLWPESIQGTIGAVLFPAFSKIQDELERLKNAFVSSLQVAIFVIIFPSLLLATLAYPFIELILSPQWLPIKIYFQILSCVMILYPLHYLNLQVLSARGKSGIFLWLEILKKTLVVINIAATVWFGVLYMVMGMIVTSIICLFINSYYTKREIGYSLWEQLRDNVQYFVYSLIACAGAYGLSQWLYPINKWASLIVPGIVGCLIYAGLNWYFHSYAFDTVWRMGWNQINGWLGRNKKSEENPVNEANPTDEENSTKEL